VHVARRVEDDAGADRVAGDGRAAAAHRHGNARLPRGREARFEVVRVARVGDDGGYDPVVGGVGGVLGSTTRTRVDLAAHRGGDVRGHVSARCRAAVGGDGHPVIVSRPRDGSGGTDGTPLPLLGGDDRDEQGGGLAVPLGGRADLVGAVGVV